MQYSRIRENKQSRKICMHSFDLTCNIVRQKELTIGVIDSCCGGGSGTVVLKL